MRPDDILVVGAGPAGLAVSACLRAEGLQHIVLEREDKIADAWHRHYDRLHLHTTKTWSGMPMTPWPKAAPRYPSRDEVIQYLHAYAAEHNIAPQLGTTVHLVSRRAERFAVDTSAGPMTPRFVVMATGYNAVPNMPSIPGLLDFRGSTIHASIYKNAVACKGKRTLVVGCGNSGAEIALDLAENDVNVAMVVRGPVHVIPREIFGYPTQHANVLLSYLPPRLKDFIAASIAGLVVGNLSRWGIQRPTMGPNQMIEEFGRVPLLDIGTVAMIKKGRIRVLRALQEILPDGVRLVSGETHPFEFIVFATGYKPNLGNLINGFDEISDICGRPLEFGQETGITGLYFVGFKNPPTGAMREIAIEALRVAKSIRKIVGADGNET